MLGSRFELYTIVSVNCEAALQLNSFFTFVLTYDNLLASDPQQIFQVDPDNILWYICFAEKDLREFLQCIQACRSSGRGKLWHIL